MLKMLELSILFTKKIPKLLLYEEQCQSMQAKSLGKCSYIGVCKRKFFSFVLFWLLAFVVFLSAFYDLQFVLFFFSF